MITILSPFIMFSIEEFIFITGQNTKLTTFEKWFFKILMQISRNLILYTFLFLNGLKILNKIRYFIKLNYNSTKM